MSMHMELTVLDANTFGIECPQCAEFARQAPNVWVTLNLLAARAVDDAERPLANRLPQQDVVPHHFLLT